MDYKQWRTGQGLSQAEAAALIGASKSTWGRIERGQDVAQTYLIAARGLVGQGAAPAPQTVGVEPQVIEASSPATSSDFESSDTAKIVPYSFDDQTIQVVEADEILMTDRQLGEALGYAKGGQAIADLAAAHMDEISMHQTHLDLRTVDGSRRRVRVWREQGVYLLTMFSAQPKAKAFRQFAAQTLFAVRRQAPPAITGDIPTWAAALLQQMGGNVIEVRQQMAVTQQRVEEIAAAVANVDQVVEDRLAAAELERRLVADGRGWIKRAVNLIAKRTEQRHSSVYAALFFALRVSRLDDVQARDQVLRAVDWLSATAKTCDLILPAYQQMLPGVAV